jgi:hypothetical protein
VTSTVGDQRDAPYMYSTNKQRTSWVYHRFIEFWCPMVVLLRSKFRSKTRESRRGRQPLRAPLLFFKLRQFPATSDVSR